MRNFTYIVTILTYLLTFISCDSNFEDINTNPNDLTVVSSNSLLAGTLRSTTKVLQEPLNAGENGSSWVQHLGKTTANDNELYIPNISSLDNTWFYLYTEVAKDADIMQKLAENEGNENLQGVALVIKANAFHILTDTYGDIPFTEALKADENLTTPIYDDSKTVIYPGILKMLDNAIHLLNGNGEIDVNQDLLYNGDYILWKKYASSLKFKILMRAASGGYNAIPELQKLIEEENLFISNEEEAKLTFLSSSPNTNPFYESLIFGNQRSQWCMSEALINYLQNTNDPRLTTYAEVAEESNTYIGKPAGIEENASVVSSIGDLYLEAEQPCYFMTYAQLCLLIAEAIEKGYIEGDSEAFFHQGIEASIKNNITTGLPSIDFANAPNKIEEIQMQIWVSTFMQGFEAWSEWRRTGIPQLTATTNDGIPTRYRYPGNQQLINSTNYTNAVNKLGGNDNLTSPLWWQPEN